MKQKENWINVRMQRLLADEPMPRWRNAFCPECHKHFTQHNDKTCNMKYEEETTNG